MKKTIAIICGTLVAGSTFAQGFVSFANNSGTQIRTNGATQGVAASLAQGGAYNYGLFIQSYDGTAAPNTPWSAGWVFTGLVATNTSAGRLTLGTVQVPGWAAGATNQFVIAGWSRNLGSEWSLIAPQAQSGLWLENGFFGVSAVSYGAASAAPPTPAFPLFGTTGPTGSGIPIQSGFDLMAVGIPEPTTFALAGLGAAAMLILRRRKS